MKSFTYKSLVFSAILLFFCIGGYVFMNSDVMHSDHTTNLSDRPSPLRDMYFDDKLFHDDEGLGAKKNVNSDIFFQKQLEEKTQIIAKIEQKKAAQLESKNASQEHRKILKDNALRERAQQKEHARRQELVVQNSPGAQVIQSVSGDSDDATQTSIVLDSPGAQVIQVGQN